MNRDGCLDIAICCDNIGNAIGGLPYSPGEYRQGVFCWKNLLAETGQLRFEKVSGNGLACEARLKYNRDKRIAFELASPTPSRFSFRRRS